MPGAAAALLLGLCALALCGQPARAQITTTNIPPEDLDGSGDDDDGFSGSGAGAVAVAERPLDPSLMSRKTKGFATTVTAATVTTVTVTAAPVTAAPAKPENSSWGEVLGEGSALTPARKPEEEPAPAPELPPSPPATTLPPSLQPVPEGTSEARPGVPGDEGSSAGGQAERGSGQQPVEESSGSGSEDFTFLAPGEQPGLSVERKLPEEPTRGETTEASQSILDRKEVLGGVIAGGLVGLLFAVLLVGFMLYRMKKKDEGSYSLEEPKQANGAYQKPQRQEEFYA